MCACLRAHAPVRGEEGKGERDAVLHIIMVEKNVDGIMVFLFNLISFSRLARHCVHSGAILGLQKCGLGEPKDKAFGRRDRKPGLGTWWGKREEKAHKNPAHYPRKPGPYSKETSALSEESSVSSVETSAATVFKETS